MKVRYEIEKATEDEIFAHLRECSDDFVPPLESKIDIRQYAKKLSDRSVTFEAWDDKKLVGLIAAYLDTANGFITNVSVCKPYMGKGLASNLLTMCFNEAGKRNLKQISLEVSANNSNAISLYKKHGFKDLESKGDQLCMKIDLK